MLGPTGWVSAFHTHAHLGWYRKEVQIFLKGKIRRAHFFFFFFFQVPELTRGCFCVTSTLRIRCSLPGWDRVTAWRFLSRLFGVGQTNLSKGLCCLEPQSLPLYRREVPAPTWQVVGKMKQSDRQCFCSVPACSRCLECVSVLFRVSLSFSVLQK